MAEDLFGDFQHLELKERMSAIDREVDQLSHENEFFKQLKSDHDAISYGTFDFIIME